MTNISAWRKASSSNIAFARRAKANTAAGITAIAWKANAWRTVAFTASWYTFWNTDATITVTYGAASWSTYIT